MTSQPLSPVSPPAENRRRMTSLLRLLSHPLVAIPLSLLLIPPAALLLTLVISLAMLVLMAALLLELLLSLGQGLSLLVTRLRRLLRIPPPTT